MEREVVGFAGGVGRAEVQLQVQAEDGQQGAEVCEVKEAMDLVTGTVTEGRASIWLQRGRLGQRLQPGTCWRPRCFENEAMPQAQDQERWSKPEAASSHKTKPVFHASWVESKEQKVLVQLQKLPWVQRFVTCSKKLWKEPGQSRQVSKSHRLATVCTPRAGHLCMLCNGAHQTGLFRGDET